MDDQDTVQLALPGQQSLVAQRRTTTAQLRRERVVDLTFWLLVMGGTSCSATAILGGL